jgi:plasmid stabilization system protein ParE
LIEEVEKVTKLISSFPLMGRISNNGKTRVLVKNKFLIFYEVYTNAIAIMSFWDGRQNPEKRMDS